MVHPTSECCWDTAKKLQTALVKFSGVCLSNTCFSYPDKNKTKKKNPSFPSQTSLTLNSSARRCLSALCYHSLNLCHWFHWGARHQKRRWETVPCWQQLPSRQLNIRLSQPRPSTRWWVSKITAEHSDWNEFWHLKTFQRSLRSTQRRS